MLVLDTGRNFLTDLSAFQKLPLVAGFEKIYNAHSEKTIEELKSLRPEELTEVLDFLADLNGEGIDADLFWDRQSRIPSELREMKPKRTERRLF